MTGEVIKQIIPLGETDSSGTAAKAYYDLFLPPERITFGDNSYLELDGYINHNDTPNTPEDDYINWGNDSHYDPYTADGYSHASDTQAGTWYADHGASLENKHPLQTLVNNNDGTYSLSADARTQAQEKINDDTRLLQQNGIDPQSGKKTGIALTSVLPGGADNEGLQTVNQIFSASDQVSAIISSIAQLGQTLGPLGETIASWLGQGQPLGSEQSLIAASLG